MNVNELEVPTCRFCGSTRLETILDFGNMPLANALLESPFEIAETYPLHVLFCNHCYMGQLEKLVSPDILYKDYVYKTGQSDSFKKHCQDLADKIKRENGFPIHYDYNSLLVTDIGCNDLTLLKCFRPETQKYSFIPDTLCGIDPNVPKDEFIKTVNELFSCKLAKKLIANQELDLQDIIIAQNVFTHVPDPEDFMNGVSTLLQGDGVFILETPWLLKILEDVEFDLMYAEHMSYLSITGIRLFLNKFNMYITDIDFFPEIHGGTLRFYIKKGSNQRKKVYNFHTECAEYREIYMDHLVTRFRLGVEKLKNNVLDFFDAQKEKVCCVGASAKATIFTNYFHLGKYIECFYDSTPTKIGKFVPGVNLPIIDFDNIANTEKDLVITAWNFKDEITQKIRKINKKSRIITLLPTLDIQTP